MNIPNIGTEVGMDTRNIINAIIDYINGKSTEMIKSEAVQQAISKWLANNEFKPKDAVATFSDLPKEAELKEIRGVLDENGVYIYGGEKWIKLYEINFNALETVNKKIDNLSSKSALYDKVYSGQTIYKKPSEFALSLPAQVLVSQNGEVSFDYDIAINKIKPTKTYYVDIKTGDNTNAGTEDKPFKTIERAFRYADADNIVVKEGIYGWTNGFAGSSQIKPFNLIGVGNVYIGAHRDNLTWTQNSVYNNVYQATGSAVVEVIDITDFENPIFFEKQINIESVSLKAGSFFIDGSNIYVRTKNDRKPDEYILPNMINDTAKLTNTEKVYFENIKFTNSVKHTASNAGQKFYAKNCIFANGTANNGLSLEGVDFIIMNCIAKDSGRDGFNYHKSGNYISNGIEIECKAFNNGRDGANQNNGSTMHDGGKIIRIRGEYHHNHGPNVIDVNDGTQSLNIGVHAHHSTADSDLSNVDFRLRDEGGGSQMWLVNCVSHDSKYSLSVEGGATETIENSLLLGPTVRL